LCRDNTSFEPPGKAAARQDCLPHVRTPRLVWSGYFVNG
jgi:hypothetical protein